MMISDVIGFLSVIAPAGFGVKEGAMYLLLKDRTSTALALLLPIATRIAAMIVDALLGTAGFILVRGYRKSFMSQQDET
jgi:uncharacterized membrane protein YbhN (UPF0104 family)